MGMAIQRIQRELRVPAMEKIVSYTMDGTGTVPVPGDLLELISIHFNDSVNQRKLTKVDLQTAVRLNNIPGIPTSFYRLTGNFLIGPVPVSGTTAYLTYYADASGLSADTDHNWITDAAPDLLIYGALSYAADYFLDDRLERFEGRFTSIVQDLQNMAAQDELENASISPAYSVNQLPFWPYSDGY
jgi:hypothetical protein